MSTSYKHDFHIDKVLPVCPTCGSRTANYVRMREEDSKESSLGETFGDVFGLKVCPNELVDMLTFACGGQFFRAGRKQFQQPEGANGYDEYDMARKWTERVVCPQAARILREMRTAQKE
jgi:hypothetical protein